MFSDSEMPTARVQQYAFLFNQLGWTLKMQFKYWILFFLGSLQIIDVNAIAVGGCFLYSVFFFLSFPLGNDKSAVLSSSLFSLVD